MLRDLNTRDRFDRFILEHLRRELRQEDRALLSVCRSMSFGSTSFPVTVFSAYLSLFH